MRSPIRPPPCSASQPMLTPPLAARVGPATGATTPDVYRKQVEDDGARAHRRPPAVADQPTANDTNSTLSGLKEKHEKQHAQRTAISTPVTPATIPVRGN